MARIGILALQGAFIEHERINSSQSLSPGSSSPAEKAPSRENSSSKKDFFSR